MSIKSSNKNIYFVRHTLRCDTEDECLVKWKEDIKK